MLVLRGGVAGGGESCKLRLLRIRPSEFACQPRFCTIRIQRHFWEGEEDELLIVVIHVSGVGLSSCVRVLLKHYGIVSG